MRLSHKLLKQRAIACTKSSGMLNINTISLDLLSCSTPYTPSPFHEIKLGKLLHKDKTVLL